MSNKEVDTKAMINLKEASDHLGISQKALRIRISKGKFPQPDARKGDELFWHIDTLRGIVPPSERLNDLLISDIPY